MGEQGVFREEHCCQCIPLSIARTEHESNIAILAWLIRVWEVQCSYTHVDDVKAVKSLSCHNLRVLRIRGKVS